MGTSTGLIIIGSQDARLRQSALRSPALSRTGHRCINADSYSQSLPLSHSRYGSGTAGAATLPFTCSSSNTQPCCYALFYDNASNKPSDLRPVLQRSLLIVATRLVPGYCVECDECRIRNGFLQLRSYSPHAFNSSFVTSMSIPYSQSYQTSKMGLSHRKHSCEYSAVGNLSSEQKPTGLEKPVQLLERRMSRR